MATINRYGEGDIVLSTDKVVTSTWSNNTNNLTTFFTSSIQATQTDPNSQGNFFINLYNMPTSSVSASVQCSIGYGHRDGSGSKDFTNDTGSFGFSATKVIYNQYRQLVYGDETQNFTFSTHTPKDIYVINEDGQETIDTLKKELISFDVSSFQIKYEERIPAYKKSINTYCIKNKPLINNIFVIIIIKFSTQFCQIN